MSEDNKNFVLFAVIAALILFGWQPIVNRFFPAANPPAAKIEDGKVQALPNPAAPAAQTPEKVQDRNVVLAASPRIPIDTPTLKGSINLKGPRIDDLVLTQYKETIARDSAPIRLLSPSGSANAYFAGFSWAGSDAPGPDAIFKPSAPVLRPGQPVTLSWTSPAGHQYQVRIAVDDHYMFTVQQIVGNSSQQPISVTPYSLIGRFGVSSDIGTLTNHVGPIGVFGGGADYDISYDNLQGKDPSFFSRLFGTTAKAGDNYFDTAGGWVGFGDKYWLAALVPDQNTPLQSGFRAASGDHFQADVKLRSATVSPGKMLTTTTHFFAGAKEVNLLDSYEDNLHIAHFGRAIDWGWFEIIEKPIFKYLDWLFRLVGNFGVAIILLTITIRALIFPIAQRQFASMAAMKAIQPKMKALQERHKDDKARAQQEIMALYKAEGVNPLAGCLPTFLQIPIMYSLYKVLLLTIDMRHQPFVLWIKDLSAPDPATPLNLFGLLHFTPPHMLAIGVVPILLGISMFFQFRLNPAPMDPAQKQVFAIMPWVLMFVMAPFAVGLQVYWITSNCITILQQQWLYSRHPGLGQAAAK